MHYLKDHIAYKFTFNLIELSYKLYLQILMEYPTILQL